MIIKTTEEIDRKMRAYHKRTELRTEYQGVGTCGCGVQAEVYERAPEEREG